MPEIQEVRDRIKNILENRLQMTAPQFDDVNAPTSANLGLDSMALLELVVGIEEDFGITVMEEELDVPDYFRDFDSLSEFVFKKVREA